jgi:hypothetical protein
MQEFSKFSLDITPAWSVISHIKKQIRVSLKNSTKDIIDRVEIIVSELLENAIKYGRENSNTSIPVNFEFTLDDSKILIVVTNCISEEQYLDEFIRIIKEIKNTKLLQSLYIKRLQELMTHTENSASKIGLYRIFSQKGILSFDYQVIESFLEIKVEIDLT